MFGFYKGALPSLIKVSGLNASLILTAPIFIAIIMLVI